MNNYTLNLKKRPVTHVAVVVGTWVGKAALVEGKVVLGVVGRYATPQGKAALLQGKMPWRPPVNISYF